jgi:nucleotide-binding universal stress UspA family protein
MATASQIIANPSWCALPAFRVVVGIDYSKASKPALDEAMWLAAERGGAVLALHVLPAQGAGERDSMDVFERHRGHRLELERYCDARRASLLFEHARVAHFSVDAHVRYGRPDVQIREFAKRVGAKLIVVGTARARSRLQRAISPPVTDAVVNDAPCPVLVARETSAVSARPHALRKLTAAAERSA